MLDYYTLQETLKMLTESSNDKYTYTAQDIATLCRQSILTPVFAYSDDCMEILEYYDGCKPLISKNGGETEYDTSRAPEPMTTHFHDGYLTDKRLLSLLDESQNKLELFNVMTYESDGSGCEIALVTNGGYTITRESLLLPSEQVQNYIASKQTIEQNTPEQKRIAELESELAQLKEQTNKQADDNTEQDHLYNWQAMDKHQYPPELHLAIEIWKEYYQVDTVKHISQFDAGRFNRITNEFNLSEGNLKSRIRSLLTPLNSKTKSPELLSSLEVINIIHNDKLEQD